MAFFLFGRKWCGESLMDLERRGNDETRDGGRLWKVGMALVLSGMTIGTGMA